jgi:hypothetical protein
MKHIGIPDEHWLARGRSRVATVAALVGLFAVGIQAVGIQAGAAAVPRSSDTGFSEPFAGTPQYEHVAPTEISHQGQLNQPLGQFGANETAREIGLNKADVFTQEQYRAFITGQGRDGSGDIQSAKLVDESVKILTNTVGHPLAYKDDNGHVVTSVLASYGLFVTTSGELESPAYETAPTYLVNSVIAPTGYMGSWMRANGATKSLEQLYESAYTSEVVYGNAAQKQSKPAELITNTKRGVRSVVGMSMGPSLWIVNFALLYMLNPSLAAEMPAEWAPIPTPVVQAIDNGDGQVAYSTVASYFH